MKKLQKLDDIKRIAILAGGWSGEREVSLSSGQGMYESLIKSGKYDNVTLIDVHKNIMELAQNIQEAQPDIILNALHGIGGEDGVIQGFLEIFEIPYSHSSVTASAVAMDKVLSRIIFMHKGIPVPTWELCSLKDLKRGKRPMPFPWVIKPKNEGSSLGISIIKSEENLQKSLSEWQYGQDILIENYIQGKEIQTAVLNGKALGTIEIRPYSEFFDYKTKYTAGAADHIMPADIPANIYQYVLILAEKAYKALECKGIARLDFLYDHNQQVYLLELNTQPGMTPCSLVPDIAQYQGMSYDDIIEKMIESTLQS